MCAFYDDEQKIKKGDEAIYKDEHILVLDAQHIKSDKTMDISYRNLKNNSEYKINVPYKTIGYNLQLIKRMEDNNGL